MKAKIKEIIGSLLLVLLPKRAKILSEKGVTLNFDLNKIDRIMSEAIIRKIENNLDYNNLAELHKNNWVNQGKHFFEITDSRFKNDFLPNASFIFDILRKNLSGREGKFNTLVEIGTGSGSVLNYLSDKFPEIEKLIGIDLSEEQVAINNTKFKEKGRLEFVASDGFDWVKNNAKSNTIFVTYGGVLEYFTEQRLAAFLSYVYGLGKVIFVAIEPIGVDHDFNVNPNTQLYGMERSFSHNYPKLFKEAGFNLWHESKDKFVNDVYCFCFIGADNLNY